MSSIWTKNDDGSYSNGTRYSIHPGSGKFRIYRDGEIMAGEKRDTLAECKKRVADLLTSEQEEADLILPEAPPIPEPLPERISDELRSAVDSISDEEIDYLPARSPLGWDSTATPGTTATGTTEYAKVKPQAIKHVPEKKKGKDHAKPKTAKKEKTADTQEQKKPVKGKGKGKKEPEAPRVEVSAGGLRIRPWDGLKPNFCSAPPNSKDAGPVPLPKDTSKPELLAWMERLIDHYEGQGEWIANSSLRFWRGWLLMCGLKNLSLTEYDAANRIISEAIHYRQEPQEYDSGYRMGVLLGQRKAEAQANGGTRTAGKMPVNSSTTIGTGSGAIRVDVSGQKKQSVTLYVGSESLSVTEAIRWMAGNGWSQSQVKRALKGFGLELAESTILSQFYAGKKAAAGTVTARGGIPEVSRAVAEALAAARPA